MMKWLFFSSLCLALCAYISAEALAEPEAEAEADPACNNCGQRPPYIKGARVSTDSWDVHDFLLYVHEVVLYVH